MIVTAAKRPSFLPTIRGGEGSPSIWFGRKRPSVAVWSRHAAVRESRANLSLEVDSIVHPEVAVVCVCSGNMPDAKAGGFGRHRGTSSINVPITDRHPPFAHDADRRGADRPPGARGRSRNTRR